MGQNEVVNPGFPGFERYTFAPAVRRGNLLFISGMTATDDSGAMVGPGDIVAQTRHIYRKLGQILDAAGAAFADVVMTTDYITTTEGYKGTADVRRELFGDRFPASTGVIVKALLRPDALIEIDAIAVVENPDG